MEHQNPIIMNKRNHQWMCDTEIIYFENVKMIGFQVLFLTSSNTYSHVVFVIFKNRIHVFLLHFSTKKIKNFLSCLFPSNKIFILFLSITGSASNKIIEFSINDFKIIHIVPNYFSHIFLYMWMSGEMCYFISFSIDGTWSSHLESCSCDEWTNQKKIFFFWKIVKRIINITFRYRR